VQSISACRAATQLRIRVGLGTVTIAGWLDARPRHPWRHRRADVGARAGVQEGDRTLAAS